MGSQEQTLHIGGVPVSFPGKPYPSQLAMMNKIIRGIEKHENCLLESPTGSGKSLALICSALAWQRAEHDKAQKEAEAAKAECECGANSSLNCSTDQPVVIGDMEDFGIPAMLGVKKADTSCEEMSCMCGAQQTKMRKIPTIWFGTRTHKQVAQIAREMGKTIYKHANMTILGSREHTCIHPTISKSAHKNDKCKGLLEGPGCPLHNRVKRVITSKNLASHGLDKAWDLEQFVGFCETNRACPYFGVRELRGAANIIFCPYNYLIDPMIRSSMEISLKNQIIILDEAHNIEDACREAVSLSCGEDSIQDAMDDLRRIAENDYKPSEHSMLEGLLRGFLSLIVNHKDHLIDGDAFDNTSRVWDGPPLVQMIEKAGLEPHNIDIYKSCLAEILQEEDGPMKREEQQMMKPKTATTSLLESLFLVVEYIFMENQKYSLDFRLAIVKTVTCVPQGGTPGKQWLYNRRKMQPKTICSLNFWCLNPAVAFESMTKDARTVVLTSGTLSPMNSFQSELGSPFPVQLEASHVISPKQVWVGAISHGPNGGSLLGSYQNSETYEYQDEVGRLVLNVIQTIPHGVLCFLPSYKSLQKLSDRWKSTGLWDEFHHFKQVFTECRGSDKQDFDDDILKPYYSAINQSEDASDDEECGGGLFFAVCRGKVSEGMDFSDNNARAVIAVGIPYPNFKDTQVKLKKKYNDSLGCRRGMLSGNDWYEIQAYRALNQALGRCIRHRSDWGALILVDDRYSKNPNKYTKGLSKWVRNKVKCYNSFNIAKGSLEQFASEMKAWTPPPLDSSIVGSQQSPLATSGSSPALASPTFQQSETPKRPSPPQHRHKRRRIKSLATSGTPPALASPTFQQSETPKRPSPPQHRHKRRRISSLWNLSFNKKAKSGVNFCDEDEDEPAKFVCPKCRLLIASSAEAVKESFEPFFLKDLSPRSQPQSNGVKAYSLQSQHLEEVCLTPITSTCANGLELNCFWDQGVAMQLLACKSCTDRGGDHTAAVPLAVQILVCTQAHPRLKNSQVWILPECLKNH